MLSRNLRKGLLWSLGSALVLLLLALSSMNAQGPEPWTIINDGVKQLRFNYPLAAPSPSLYDDFVGGGTATDTIGALGWNLGGTCGTPSAQASTFNNPGVIQIPTGTSAGNVCAVTLASGGAGTPSTLGALGNNAGWTLTFTFQTASDPQTTVGYYIGAVDSLTAVPTNWFGLRSDTAQSDTAYKLCVSTTCDSTTYASDNTNFHKLRIRSVTAGEIRMSLDGNPEKSFCAANCDNTVTPPSNALTAGWTTVTRAAAARNLRLEAFTYQVTGVR